MTQFSSMQLKEIPNTFPKIYEDKVTHVIILMLLF